MENYGLHVEIPRKTGIIEDTPLTALAFFLGPPQGWRISKWPDTIVKKFTTSLDRCNNLTSEQIVVHGCYLINPASLREEVRIKSEKRFLEEVKLCDVLGAGNYVFHPGVNKDTHKSLQKTVDLINLGLRDTKNVNILVENMTKTNTLCQTWQEVEWVINHVEDNSRVGTCLDTAHCWGAGEKKGMFMDTLLDDFDRIVGIEHLKAIHLNDSKVAYGSNKDRHEDILKGQIPFSFWNSFIFDERVKTIPSILETPSNCHSVITEIIKNGGVKVEEKVKRNLVEIDFFSFSGKLVVNKNKNEVKEKLNSVVENTTKLKEIEVKVEEKVSVYEKLETLFPEDKWEPLYKEFEKSYFQKLKQKLVEDEAKGVKMYPPPKRIFRLFHMCDLSDIKVVVCGQNPYKNYGEAEGFSFSVPKGIKIPSSLRNIYKELSTDVKFKVPRHGHLAKWVEQGVFLLNAGLTVKAGDASSHLDIGWQQFTITVLKYIDKHCKNVVFMLWGNFAKKLCGFVNTKKHYVLKSVHPSGLSAHRGFYGCKHFSKCNKYLKSKGLKEIDWQV
jgi:uracil-DNA glycosylase